MTYPGCPNCGRELQIGDFYRLVGARRLPTYLDDLEDSPSFAKDPSTGEIVPMQFSITCGRCGATSAVDIRYQGIVPLTIGVGIVVLLGLLFFVRPKVTWVFFLLAASLCITVYRLWVWIPTGNAKMKVTLISMPDPELANETAAERRARADRDMDVQINRLGPRFQQVYEPPPLEPELADVASQIDAAYEAAPLPSGRPEYERAEEEELERSKVVCAACGEMNQRDFKRCWNCEGLL